MADNYEMYKAHHFIAEAGPWTYWAERLDKPVTVKGLGVVTVVHTLKESRGYTGYGYGQGSTAPAGMVFKVAYLDGSVRHFEKQGTYDSYGEAQYSGVFFEVKTVEKTILTFEPTDPGKRA